MPDKKLTDNEIIKALNNCRYGYKSCDECPLCNDPCEIDHGGVPIFIVDLINRLQAENEALIAGQETLQKYIAEQKAEIERLKSMNQAKLDMIHDLRERLGE